MRDFVVRASENAFRSNILVNAELVVVVMTIKTVQDNRIGGTYSGIQR
jgi:hypothetical protein